MKVRQLLPLALVANSWLGCAHQLPARRTPQPRDAAESQTPQSLASDRETLVRWAQKQVGRHIYADCSDFIVRGYRSVGLRLQSAGHRRDNGVTAIYRYAASQGTVFRRGLPLPGDLIFFRDTYDANRDGRVNDGLTHIGLVERIDDNRTVWFIHRLRQGVVRHHLNLDLPHQRTQGGSGAILNDFLRVAEGKGETLTGELFFAYGSVLTEQIKDPGYSNLPGS